MPMHTNTTPQLVTGPPLDAWQRLLRAHIVIARCLDAELRTETGMTLSDYDVLVHLRDSECGALTMSGLASRTLLTRSGMTRLVQGLERTGLVERRSCDSDARVSYAVITQLGRDTLRQARILHHEGIRRMFADHFSDEEAAALSDLLARIPGVTDEAGCGGCDAEVPAAPSASHADNTDH
jgi:DNA-binding MarR family transcriptional regulator